jgi:decaprenyl-phosphate phosphoribosyltransferase
MAERDEIIENVFSRSIFVGLIRLMRPKQWIKNSFVFAPVLFSNLFFHKEYMFRAFFAALLFCMASSATYIVNDIYDLKVDRQHHKKKKLRPLASGQVKISQGVKLLIIIYSLLILGLFQFPSVAQTIFGYLFLNLAYTFFLKHQPIIDIFTISSGFILRVYAGALAVSVPVSSWMFITVLCLALYLASVKRRQELIFNSKLGRNVNKYYTAALLNRYAEISAIASLMFYSLYVMSEHPDLVITIPFVIYGIFRYWYLVELTDAGESPTETLLADGQLLITIIIWVALCSHFIAKTPG